MRYELEGTNLTVLPDSPFLRHYKVEYPNLKRVSQMSVGSTTSVSGGGGSGGGSNGSSASITDSSSNQFWETLVGNIKDLLRETDKVVPAGGGAGSSGAGAASPGASAGMASPGGSGATSGAPTGGGLAGMSSDTGSAPTGGGAGGLGDAAAALLGNAGKGDGSAGSGSASAKSSPQQQGTIFRESASVIANAEGGIISVRATMKQHQKVREFIDRAMSSVRRQVLIEGTIVEVDLSDEFQQGINWSLLSQSGNLLIQSGPVGGSMPSGVPVGGVFPSMGLVSGAKKGLFGGPNDFQAAIRLLESFGRARVLSSPKISALNNQPAMLRVVDNLVYFTVSGSFTPGTVTTPATVSVSSTANTASVGFTLGVTPQIGADNEVTLLLRPTISRVLSYVDDPAVGVFMSIARAGGSNIPEVTSRVPQIQTREMESVIKVRGGMTAVLGGLMRDSGSSSTDEIPGAGTLGAAGDLLRYKSRKSSKSELVIFLRPVIISDASLEGDYAPWRSTLSRVTGPDPYTTSGGGTP
jgi:general secretion pathway protein D